MNKIKELRKEKNITVAELAKELKNRKAKTAESEKQKRRLHESELLSRQRVTPETTPCAFRYA